MITGLATTAGVILLGGDTPIALSIVRELGQQNIRVHVVSRAQFGIAAWSRYASGRSVRPQGEEALTALLLDIAAKQSCAYLMTISESDILFVNRHRARLSAALKLLVPDQACIAKVLDKRATMRIAEALNIATPLEYALALDDRFNALAADIQYPVVLKWADPNAIAPRLLALGLPMIKTEYCNNAEELHAALHRYAALNELPLVQQYCAGYGLGQFVYMHRGRALLCFQHRRLREWPPEGGFSVVCEAVAPGVLSEVMAQSIALLRAIEWEGAAMVEYRYDEKNGRASLLEINGRFWGSLPLAYHCGARFALLTYAVQGNGQALALPPARSDLRCRFLYPEIKRLLRIVLQPDGIKDPYSHFSRIRECGSFVLDFFRPGTRYFVFYWRDPLPLAMDVFNALSALGRAVLKRLR